MTKILLLLLFCSLATVRLYAQMANDSNISAFSETNTKKTVVTLTDTSVNTGNPLVKLDSAVHSTHLAFFEPSHTFNNKRFLGVAASTTVALASSYVYVQTAWWKDNSKSFHFDGGADLKYAKNLDKFGHFFGGVIYGDLFAGGMRWAGSSEKKSKLWGGVFGTSIQAFVEIKDGYSPNWGFSVFDLLSGSAGAFYPYFQTQSRLLAATDMKLSYYKRDDFYFKNQTYKGQWNDDYMNQTYWFTFNPKRYNPNWKWPAWLGISAGFSIDNKLNDLYTGVNDYANHGKGHYEWFLAPDIDFKALLPKTKGWQKLAHVLNYVKVPAPTIRLKPSVKGYLFYF